MVACQRVLSYMLVLTRSAVLRALLLPLTIAVARCAAARKVATSPAEDSPPLLEPLQLNAETRPLAAEPSGKKRLLPKATLAGPLLELAGPTEPPAQSREGGAGSCR